MASRELKWLGYLLVREGVLEPDSCRATAEPLGDEPDFIDYAQAIADNGLVEDFEQLQNLVDQAFAKGSEDEDPPVDIFKKHTPPPAEEAPPEPEVRPPLRLRMDSTPEKEPTPVPKGPTVLAEGGASVIMNRHGEPMTGTDGLKRTPPKPKAKAVPLAGVKPAPAPAPASETPTGAEKPVGRKKIPFKKKEETAQPPPPVAAPVDDVPDLVFDVDEQNTASAPRPAARPQARPAAPPEPPAKQHDGGHGGGRAQKSLASRSDVPMPSVTSGGPIPSVNSAIGKSPAEAGQILARILVGVRELGASDLHLSAGAKPFYRKNMANTYLEEEILDPRAAVALNTSLLSADQKEEFETVQDLDYSLALDDRNRFRVNLMVHKEGVAGTYRLVPNEVKDLPELGFVGSDVINSLLDHHNGLILVTGPVGSGKTTTLAALVKILNEDRYDHIITVEDPIEIVQSSANCNLTQRQVGMHTQSFFTALKGALREDPDIIVIGELRDLETIEMAITAAETGHLVIGTLHTSDAATTLNRILDVFPPAQQAQISSMTAESLRGIVCQKLVPNVHGTVSVIEEILIGTLAVSNIIREGKMHQLRAVLETGSAVGMCSMDQSIERLWKEGTVTTEVAIANVVDTNLKKRFEAQDKAAASEAQAAAEAGAGSGDSTKKKKGWFR